MGKIHEYGRAFLNTGQTALLGVAVGGAATGYVLACVATYIAGLPEIPVRDAVELSALHEVFAAAGFFAGAGAVIHRFKTAPAQKLEERIAAPQPESSWQRAPYDDALLAYHRLHSKPKSSSTQLPPIPFDPAWIDELFQQDSKNNH
jgi:hypothetical protein